MPDPFFNTSAIPKAGFISGHGRPVAPPSSAALARVKKMFEEVEEQSTPLPDHDHFDTPNKRRKIDQTEEEEEIPDIPAPDFVMMESKGFVTGKGKAVPPPSKAAVEKAMKIIAAVEEEKEEFPDSTPVIPKMSFTTGNGNAVAGPSSQALAAAEKLFGEDGPSSNHGNLATPVKSTGFTTGSGAPAPMASEAARKRALAMFGEGESTSTQGPGPSMATPVRSAGFTTGSGAAAPMASEAARRKAMAMFGEDSTGSPSRPTTSMLPPTSTPFRPLVQPTSTPQRPTNNGEPSSEFRTPLRATTNILVASQTSTLPRTMPMKKLQAIEIKTPAPQRRVGLGRTPTSTKGGVKNKFSTPFKQPGKSLSSPLKPATSLRTSNAVAGPSGLSRAATPAPAKEASVPVFDLTSKLLRPSHA
jgi:breast cancer 2 susceptibility protein